MKYVILIHANPDPWGHPTSIYTAEGRTLPPEQHEEMDRQFEALLGEISASMTSAGQEDVWRRCAPHVLAALVRRYGDFDAAEDAVQEALLAAARQWPTDGIPDNPRGWLITVASRRLADQWRAEQARTDREQLIARHTPPEAFLAPAADTLVGGERDNSLTLLLLCCHPALTRPSQVALRLRAVAGLSTAQMDGQIEEARAAYATAARLATSIPEQRYLNSRAAQRAPV